MYQHWSHISFLWGLLWFDFIVAVLLLKFTVLSSDVGMRKISEAEVLAQFLFVISSCFTFSVSFSACRDFWLELGLSSPCWRHGECQANTSFHPPRGRGRDTLLRSTRSLAQFLSRDMHDTFQSFAKGLSLKAVCLEIKVWLLQVYLSIRVQFCLRIKAARVHFSAKPQTLKCKEILNWGSIQGSCWRHPQMLAKCCCSSLRASRRWPSQHTHR